MTKFSKKRSKKAGLPPGTLIHTGERTGEPTRMIVYEYDVEHFTEKDITAAEDLQAYKTGTRPRWINVYGLSQVDVLEKLGHAFGVHPLVLEDIVNTDQRPKMEDYGDYLYIVLMVLSYDEKRHEIVSQQVSLILGDTYLISFQESAAHDHLAPVRERLRLSKGRIRSLGVDHLAYALVDAVVDNYFVMLEKLGERVDQIEDDVMGHPQSRTLRDIHKLKREMIFVRRSVWPVREVITGLERLESSLIKESTLIYLRDLYDHTVHAIETIETLRDMLAGMVEIYLSSMTHRLNEVIKVLTVITTLFMPPTLIAGIYGMNFRHMPELDWRWGYPGALAIMVVTGAAMYWYLRRRKWS